MNAHFVDVFPGATCHKMILDVQDLVCRTRTAEGDSCTSAGYQHRIMIMSMMNEIECGPNPRRLDAEGTRQAKNILSYAEDV